MHIIEHIGVADEFQKTRLNAIIHN